MKKFTTNKRLIQVIILLLISNVITYAQKYGGSAYVTVKDKEGRTRVLNTTVTCIYKSESDAKTNLERSLNSSRSNYFGEEFDSGVSYSINSCNDDDSKKYGGSAYAHVKDKQGKSRVINSTVSCIYYSEVDAKINLERSLNNSRSNYSGEEFDSNIKFDIDSCDK